MVEEKNKFSSKTQHNFAKGEAIPKYKNDKPWNRKSAIHPPF